MSPARRRLPLSALARAFHMAFAMAFALACLSSFPSSARAEIWLCPVCDARVERATGAATLDCTACAESYDAIDLSPAVLYANSRTRNIDIAWTLQSADCDIFRPDGVRADDADGEVWAPWSKVAYFIPRQRILRLNDGREFMTGYAKGVDTCVEPPKFAIELVDTVRVPGRPPTLRKLPLDEDLAALFFVAQTPEDREAAQARFEAEIEAGKHPRLPRTPARFAQPATIVVPQTAAKAGAKGTTVLDVRTHDRGGIIEVRVVQKSGNDELDREAIRVAQSSGYQSGGEMGVAVPSWIRLRFTWTGATGSVAAETSPLGVWGT